MTDLKIDGIFPKGHRIEEHFIGEVYLEMLVEGDQLFDVPVGNVTFAPEARNDWHIHDVYQVLMVTAGKGYYQVEGEPVQILQKGDVVKIPANVKHWHGATAKDWFVHLAMTKGATQWLEAVTDEYYNQLV